jgi:DnaJ-class molecular chaperone
MMRNYYDILGLDAAASQAEVRQAYLKLARENHPDLHPEDVEGFTRRFQDINEAYTNLHDAGERERFDRRWAHFQAGDVGRVSVAVVRKARWEGPGEKYRKARGGRSRYFSRPGGFFGMR